MNKVPTKGIMKSNFGTDFRKKKKKNTSKSGSIKQAKGLLYQPLKEGKAERE